MIRLALLPIATLVCSLLIGGGIPAPEPAQVFYPEHLTGAYTGGFGEETCRSCHFDYNLNPEEGKLTVSGFEDKVSAGQQVQIQINVEREELGAAGFQLSARYENGKQAGNFELGNNERIMFSKSVPDSVQYLQHTGEGSKPGTNNSQTWTVTWEAPDSVAGPVIFNLAVNAANGDQSEFGDFIYSGEWVIGY